ncbi:LysE family translocator [Desulfogranum mediterraneum]|uniref:LysE family translocator n=1 Tax=Desulfogranum mediterraneum TaxID=160661 RepID=UPI0003F6E60B|nr:LysE family translocator [Desulfogranum mediterraneum]
MDPAGLTTFVAASLVLTLSPGVDTILVIRNVLRGGSWDGLFTALGICSGLFVHALLSACGVSVILLQSALLFTLLKGGGALYLIWLGLKSCISALRGGSPLDLFIPPSASRDCSWRLSLREGLFSNLLNPKPIIFYMAFLPQFIAPGDSVLVKSLGLTCIHFAFGILWLGTVSLALQRISGLLLRPAVGRSLEGLCGSVLLFFGVQLALVER